jgi:hypothetical protein
MVEVPSGLISLWPWPPDSGATALRRWARGYSTQHGFVSKAEPDPPAAQAFRHALVSSAIYLDAYRNFRLRYGPEVADRLATSRTLQLGNLSELNGPNPVPKHLMDYWNNYEGVRLGREIASKEGPDVTNDRLAQIVAGEINASIQAPMGKGRFILFNGHDQHGVNFKDPRLELDRYDLNRLPNEGWGIGPLPKPEGYIPPAIIEAFPHLYKSPAPPPAPWSAPRRYPVEPADVPDPALSPLGPPQGGGGGTNLDLTHEPERLRADGPGVSTVLAADGRLINSTQQTAPANASGLPEHVSGENAPGNDSIMGGQPPPRPEQRPISIFADLIPQPTGAPLKTPGQSLAYQQVAATAGPGLPQHVIDAGNLLRANGYQITPRTMYLAHVLGPQAAVDLINRTGSTSSPAVPSPDAATGDQMRAWVRALRLGPAAQAGLIGSLAPAPNPGPAVGDPSNGDGVAPTGSWA